MWNKAYSNRKCNELERIKDHRMHLERIITIRSSLDIAEPHQPKFLKERLKKEKMDEGSFCL
jgi:hypothetical protein